MKARYQDPTIGRFLSEDPAFWDLSVNLSDPQAWNSYAYARNSPVVMTDPDGRMSYSAIMSGYANTSMFFASPALYALNQSPQSREFGLRAAPVTGDVIDLAEAFSGKDIFDGSTLSAAERSFTALGAVTFGGLSTVRKGADVATGLKLGEHIDGLGTVTENIGGSIKNLNHNGSFHGLDQAITRGVKPDTLLSTVKSPLLTFSQPGGRMLYLSKEAGVVMNKAGSVVTTWSKNEFYPKISQLISKVSKK